MNEIPITTPKTKALTSELCDEFINSKGVKKYLMGRNVYAHEIVKYVSIDGFVDDYTDEKLFLNKPVCKLENVPENAIILVLSGGLVLTALNKVRQRGFQCLHYFEFYKHSGLPLRPPVFMEDFEKDFAINRDKYEWVYSLLSDDTSKRQFSDLINFKSSLDISFLKNFHDLEKQQYFEDFLYLKKDGEIFVDVGGYDGYTTEFFAELCPGYERVEFFEPDINNLIEAKNKLKDLKKIKYHQLGLSDKKETLKFSSDGSASKVDQDGDITINLDRLDNMVNDPISFLKMDIEGAEKAALLGAENLIKKYKPKMAICVYHSSEDMWKIPEIVLNMNPDYKVFLRHYTESIYETVMFFIPGTK